MVLTDTNWFIIMYCNAYSDPFKCYSYLDFSLSLSSCPSKVYTYQHRKMSSCMPFASLQFYALSSFSLFLLVFSILLIPSSQRDNTMLFPYFLPQNIDYELHYFVISAFMILPLLKNFNFP